MNIRGKTISLFLALSLVMPGIVPADGHMAGDVVKNTSTRVLERLQAEKSRLDAEPGRLYELINELVLPHFDFYSMSRYVLGSSWKNATPEQQQQFVDQFRTLLVRTYANALKQYSDNEIVYHPEQASEGSPLVVVRTEVKGAKGVNSSNSIPIHYRMHSVNGAWKVIDVSVDGVSLVSTYRGSFASEIRNSGLDTLISRLAERNHTVEPGNPQSP